MAVSKFSLTFPNQNNGHFNDYYDLHEELGSGAFSVVKRGTEKRAPHTPYAIKIVDKKQTNREEMYMELAVMSRLNHPNIVYFKEIFEDANAFSVVMELITGGELFDKIIELRSYSEKDAAHVMFQILSGLKHMHDKKLIHRDLKPENLLLSSKNMDAVVKIADFGFATICESSTLDEWVGTPPYMAPELAALSPSLRRQGHSSTYGSPVDIWALGVILYILLSGVHPFQMENEEQMLVNIYNGKWTWLGSNWTKVSEDAKMLIKGMLELEPNKRLRLDECLHHPWLSTTTDDVLEGIQESIKSFQAKKKFRSAILGVMATNKLKALMGKMRLEAQSAKPKNFVTMKIMLIAGKNLSPKDINGKSDPYMVMFYNGSKYKTKTIKKTLNPVWDEEFILPYVPGQPLIMQCWDWDLIGSDDFMGEIIIPSDHIASAEEKTVKWYPVGQKTIGKKGEVTHKIKKKHVVSGSIEVGITKISD